jgi:hypothetical protein
LPSGAVASDPGAPILLGPPAVHAPTATVRDTAELLDVHVHELTRASLLISGRARATNRESGGLIQVRQQRHPIPDQDPPDLRRMQAQSIPDPMRTPSAGEPQRNDPPLGATVKSSW